MRKLIAMPLLLLMSSCSTAGVQKTLPASPAVTVQIPTVKPPGCTHLHNNRAVHAELKKANFRYKSCAGHRTYWSDGTLTVTLLYDNEVVAVNDSSRHCGFTTTYGTLHLAYAFVIFFTNQTALQGGDGKVSSPDTTVVLFCGPRTK